MKSSFRDPPSEDHEAWSSGGLSTSRIEAFSDGVFAIVITLLVLDLKPPQLAPELVDQQLSHKLLEFWPKYLGYAMSFGIVGIYWVGHHNMFHYVRYSDRALLWINILFLMCVAFMPFPTALLGQYGAAHGAVLFYGVCLAVTGLVLAAMWWYVSGHDMIDEALEPIAIKRVTGRLLTIPILSALAIGLSFWNPRISFGLYALMPLIYIWPDRLDRLMVRRMARNRKRREAS